MIIYMPSQSLFRQHSRKTGKFSSKLGWGALMVGVSHIAGLGTTSAHAADNHAADNHAVDNRAFQATENLALVAKPTPIKTAANPASEAASALPKEALSNIALTPLPGDISPILSVGLIDAQLDIGQSGVGQGKLQQGKLAKFLGSTNYPASAIRAELRIFAANNPDIPHAIVEVDENGVMEWMPSTYASEHMFYTYRVYDESGTYDETLPQSLIITPPTQEQEENGCFTNCQLAKHDQSSAINAVDAGGQYANMSYPLPPLELPPPANYTVSTNRNSEAPVALNSALDTLAPATVAAAVAGDGMQMDLNARSTADGAAQGEAADEQSDAENPYNIAIRSDSTHVDPVLAVALRDSQRAIIRGQEAAFLTYSNYNAFITKRELRLFSADRASDTPPLAIIPADADGHFRWLAPLDAPTQMFYILRVYDDAGNFDETTPQELTVLEEEPEYNSPPVRPLFGSRDETAKRNIRMHKSMTITTTGNADPKAEIVRVNGHIVPVHSNGKFVSEQIVPRNIGMVRITVGTDDTSYFTALRDVEEKGSDWFVVGQGDLTFVSSKGAGPAVEVSGNPLMDGDYITSRAAFYAKGNLASGVRITSSLDTGETLLKDIFSNLDRKDPRQLLRRLGSNQYYTPYGDDSTLVQDAPTQGRFYLKVENLKVDKGRAGVLIGNFVADIDQGELAQINRGLFGAIMDYKSVKTTSFGEADQQITVFASDPGTIPGRDEFRGTGGSLYFLKQRDLAVGSERLSVEIRDRDTGIVLSRRDLRAQEDYDIDYFQGRISLLSPLSSFAQDGGIVRQNSGGNIPVLVARYEYTPAVGDLRGYTIGGRASTWLKDTVRLGFTAQREATDSADQMLVAGDMIIRAANGTYFKAEIAQSQGPGFGQSNSVDGGLTFTDIAAPGVKDNKALAYRAEVAIDLADLQKREDGRNLGKLSAFYEKREAGFNANGQLASSDTTRWGVELSSDITKTTTIQAKVEQLDNASYGTNTTASAQITQQLARDLALSAQLRHSRRASPSHILGAAGTGAGGGTGKRSDGAFQLDYTPQGKNWSLFGFGQATLERDGTRPANNRGGIGGKATISDRLSASGEVSHGTGGLGANAELRHTYGNGSENYIGYAVLADRTDTGLSPSVGLTQNNDAVLTFGTRHRFSSALSAKAENRFGYGGDAPSVMRSFGLDWAPGKDWSVSGSYENGYIDNPASGRFRRNAVTLGVGLSNEKIQWSTNIEGRFEKGQNRNQQVWLFRNTAALKLHPDWRALGRLNFAIADNKASDGTQIDVRAADFVEGTLGVAYRPVNNDRINMLGQFTYLRDFGPVGQITAGGENASPKQESQIFSLDTNIDVTKELTLGAKYAFRKGTVSLGRDSNDFVSSNTHLGVIRADWRMVKEWDVLIEGHYLSNNLAGDEKWGGLAGIYRHIGENVKLGVGYSFSDFSSNLTDQSYTSKGYFINILSKF